MTVNALYEFFVSEAVGDTAETSEPVDTQKNDSNKDLAADSTDTSKDTTDAVPADDNSDTTSDTSAADDTSTDSTDTSTDTGDDSSAVASDDGGDDTSTPAPEEVLRNNEKKARLYKGLREIKLSFVNLSTVYSTLLKSNVQTDNLEAIRLVKEKIDFNVQKLTELLVNENIARSKTYADLQVLFNIYLGDLKLIDTNLQLYTKTDKQLNKSLSSTRNR